MAEETPKPMRKVHRNIFHKVGKKLEKFEQSLVIPSPHLSQKYPSSHSLNYLPTNYDNRNSEYDEEGNEHDTVSLQNLPHPHSESPRDLPRYKHNTDQLTYPHSSTVINNTDFPIRRESNTEEYVDQIMKNPSKQYDKGMEILCKELIEDKSVNLYDYRDYEKKVSLLRIAMSFNTPKVTVPVILFLENTLSKSLFYELIKQYPSAMKTYMSLAKLRLENDHYIAMLKYFDRNEDIALIRLRQANQINDINTKIAFLDQVAIDFRSHYWWHSQIAEYQHLLRKQRELQRLPSSSQSNIQLENRTVLDTYKVLFDIDFRQQKDNRNRDKTNVERSKDIETAFHMSPEMIMCGRLSVIMQCGLRMHYDDFFHQAIHQGLFGRKYVIEPENYADMVYKWVIYSGEGQLKASEKAGKYINLIQNPKKRIYYAEKFENYDIAMDTIAHVFRDRVQFENLRKRMPHDHPSFNKATSLLENTKWKN